jgi:hypothetical protein
MRMDRTLGCHNGKVNLPDARFQQEYVPRNHGTVRNPRELPFIKICTNAGAMLTAQPVVGGHSHVFVRSRKAKSGQTNAIESCVYRTPMQQKRNAN